jgi:hypothetical protein
MEKGRIGKIETRSPGKNITFDAIDAIVRRRCTGAGRCR